MNINQKRKKRISIRLTNEQFSQVKKLSVINKISVSKFIRAFVFSSLVPDNIV
jgi:predicted DNA binding CopG/RHH family protein